MRRFKRSVMVVVVLAAGMVFLPGPTIVWASEMETTTIDAVLAPVTEAAIDVGLVEESHEPHDVTEATTDSDAPVLGSGLQIVEPFTTIGVTVERLPHEPIAVRVRVDGVWQAWRELAITPDHEASGAEAAAGRPGITSEPYFVGQADAYELQVPADAGAVDVHTVAEISTRVAMIEGDTADGAPAIGTRSAWGARAPGSALGEADRLDFAVIHHSDTSNAYSPAQVPALLRSIQAYHMDANGWSDIGYNFVVDRFGGMWEGRAGGIDRATVGAHASGFNTGSTGVMILGDFDAGAPTPASLDAAETLVSWKLAHHQVPTEGTFVYRPGSDTKFGPAGTSVTLPRVVGHRDVGQTSCPGSSLYSRLGTMGADITAQTAGFQAEAASIVVPGDRSGDGKDDLALVRAGAPLEVDLRGAGTAPVLGLGGSGPSLRASSFSVAGNYRPLTGDFDGNGSSDVFWYAPGAAADHVWFYANGSPTSVPTRVLGSYEPFVGDFDGDGRDDIFWYAPYADGDAIWWGSANRRFVDTPIRVAGGYEPLIADYDGDGRDDVFWYAAGSRPDYVWYGGGDRRFASVARSVSGSYQPFTADLTGDGRAEIVWFTPGTSTDYVHVGRADRGLESAPFLVSGRYRPVVGDFAGDGHDDIFWNAPDGSNDELWRYTRSGIERNTVRIDVGLDLTVLDADGNGSDEFFARTGSASGALWQLSGSSFRSVQNV